MSEVHEWIGETARGECAALLKRFVTPLMALGAGVQADVGSFGARFCVGGAVLCELSVFGELFIVRVGSEQTVEYRVRRETVALQALDHILQHYIELQAERTCSGNPG